MSIAVQFIICIICQRQDGITLLRLIWIQLLITPLVSPVQFGYTCPNSLKSVLQTTEPAYGSIQICRY